MDSDTHGPAKQYAYGSCCATSRADDKGVQGVKDTGFLKITAPVFLKSDPGNYCISRAQPLVFAAALTAQATVFTTRRLRTSGRTLSFCGRLTNPASA